MFSYVYALYIYIYIYVHFLDPVHAVEEHGRIFEGKPPGVAPLFLRRELLWCPHIVEGPATRPPVPWAWMVRCVVGGT